MPSPFPGMDPSLESPDWFPSLKLPVIAGPLVPGDADVPLDLQSALDRAYDDGPYDRAVRYDMAQVNPPLPTERQQSLNGRLARSPLALVR
jgi:hypothetical protein